MKYFRFLLLVLLISNVFIGLEFADGTKAGRLYEQVVPTSYANPPTITLYGKSSITTSETLNITASSTYCSTCNPFYYWRAREGVLMKQSNPRTTKWIPPTNFTGSKYFTIFCTIGDGKGLVATASHQVLVTNDGGSSGGGGDLVDPVVSNVRVASSTLTVGVPTTIYWTAADSQTPASQLSIWIQKKVSWGWDVVNATAPNTGSISWTPHGSGNDLKVRVCATDAAGNESAWAESNSFIVVEQDYVEPPTSTFLYDPGVETPNSSVNIKWRKIIDSKYQLNVNYYELQYAPNSSFSGAITLIHYDNSDPGNIYSANIRNVGGLQDNTRYYFRVRGVNDTAVGPWSNTESILINLEHLPYFNTSYQYPANGAVGVSKIPVLQWEAHDNDGDNLDYYVLVGTDPGNLYTVRAFRDPESQGHNWFDFGIEHFEPLKPNTTYYWKVKLREDGRYADYYGGEYISSPLWNFTTLNSGSDLAIINAVVDSEVKPASTVRFKVTVKNLGSETADRVEFIASYIKNGVESPFRTCIGYMTDDLAPSQEEIVNVDVQFRTYIIENNGQTYDNILISGDSQVKLSFNWNNPQDMNWNNNQEIVPIYYEDAGGPVIDYFDLREHGSMYENWGVDFWARMGQDLVVVVNAHDDVQVARFLVQQRYHQTDAWTTIYDQANDSQNLNITQQGGSSNGFVWPVPIDIEGTDDAQFKVILYDDKNNLTEKVSDPFSIVSNRIDASIEPLASTYKVGETLQYNINYDSDNIIIEVVTWLTYGSHKTSIYSDYNENGITINNPIEWPIPDNNLYVSDYCYLECKLLDDKGNAIEVLSEKFRITPNTSVPAPFNEAIVIYDDEFSFPVDALYEQQNRFIEFVKIDENNLTHLVLEHNYSYYQDTASDYNEDTYVYENNKYYITYDTVTTIISSKILICNKDHDVVHFDLIDGIPYVLLKDKDYETLYYSQKSGSSFTAPVPIENIDIPKLASNPVFKSSVDNYSNRLCSPERHVLLNGYLWELDIFTTRIYRYSFNNGIIGAREYYTINNNETLESYRIRPVTSGNIIYYIDAGRSKLAKLDTSTGNVQSFSLPFSTSSMNSDWKKCNVALGEFNGKMFLFGNGRVYEFVNNSFVERGPIAYSFGSDNVDYSTANWSNVDFLRTIHSDNKLYLLMEGFFWSTAKPTVTYYEILEFNSSTYQFIKTIAQVKMSSRIESDSAYGIAVTGNPDLLYIGNNKVLSVFASDTSNSNELHNYYAVLKMLDLANGDVIFLGQLPFKSSGPVSLHQDNSNIYILAENKTSYQAECYQISMQNLENRVKQIRNPHFVQHNGSLFATWAFGHPFDGTWNFDENALNDWLLSRNKAIPIYPSQGIVSNISDEYLGSFTTVGADHLSSEVGKVWSLNPGLTVNQLVYDEEKYGGSSIFKSFGSTYVGTLTFPNNANQCYDATLLKSDYTVAQVSGLGQGSKFAAYDDLLIAGSYKETLGYISKIALGTNQRFDVAIGSVNSGSPYNSIDMNANKYVAVGWDVYLAVADFSGDIVAPTVTINNTETQIINNTSITLTWNADDNNNQLDKYEVYKEVNGNRLLLTTITDINTTSYLYTVNESSASEIKLLVLAYDQDGNIGEDSLVLTIVIYTEDLTSFTLDKSTVPIGGTVIFNWTATSVDATTTYTVSKRQSGTTEWQTYFQVNGQLTKQMVINDVPGTYDFKIEAGADSIVLTNALTVSGDIPVFDYSQFGTSNSGYYSEPAMVTLSWNIQPFSNQNLVTYDVYVNPNSSGYSKIETTTNTFSNYPIPNGVTNINWKITANYQSAQYESNEQTSSLTPLTSPAVCFIELRDNNTDNPTVYLEFTTIQGISEYIVTRQNAAGEYLELATITENNYTDSTVNYGETYEYGILSKFGTLKGLKGVTQVIPIIIRSVDSVVILNENFTVIEDTSLILNYQPNPLDAYEKYEIFWGTDPDALQPFTITNSRSVTFTDLNYDTAYYVQVNALDANGIVMATSDLFVFFTPTEPVELPAAPGELSGEMVSLYQIELRWTDNDNNELGFMIERKEGPTGTYEQIYVTDRNYHIDSNDIAANTSYFYRVRAYNSAGYSNYSNEAPVVSSIILVTSPNGGESWEIGSEVTITWDDNISGNVDIELSRDSGSAWESLDTNIASDGTKAWTVTGPTSNSCVIKISETGGTLTDTSNGTFSIIEPLPIPEIERNTLIDLYNSTDGDNWTNNSGWKDTPLHTDGFAMPGTEGTWAGITVANGHVIRIELGENNLSGSIPSTLGNLTILGKLDLFSNQLTGTIPSSLGSLSNLTYLSLGRNQLTGNIPTELGSISSLQQLFLYENQLTGGIPSSFGNLSSLKSLDLNSNQLIEHIPEELGSASNLEEIRLHNNQLNGNIPNSFGSLSKLTSLNLSSNKLTGSIPTSLINLNTLSNTNTDIGYNGLYTDDESLRAFITSKDPDWESTQTIAPANVTAAVLSSSSIEVSWATIPYTTNTGGYRVFCRTAGDADYSQSYTTTDKTVPSKTITNLVPDTTYYIVVQTVTEPHDNNQNRVESLYSEEVSATTPFTAYITVTSPNGGEIFEAGTTQTINWDAAGNISEVYVSVRSLENESVFEETLTANPGSTSWPISPSLSGSFSVLVRASFTDGSLLEDTSDTYFTVIKSDTVDDSFSSPESISSASTNLGEVDLAVDSENNLHAVWSDDFNLFYRKRTGTNWETIAQLTTDNTVKTNGQNHVLIDVGTDNRPHIIYKSTSDDLYYTYHNGTNFTSPTNITNTGNVVWYRIAADTNNSLHLIFRDIAYHVHYRKISQGSIDPTASETLWTSCGDTIEIAVASPDDIYAFRGCDGISYRRFNNDSWAESQPLTMTPGDGYPCAETDASGTVHLVWRNTSGGTMGLWYATLNNSGEFSTPTLISNSPGLPMMALDKNGDPVVSNKRTVGSNSYMTIMKKVNDEWPFKVVSTAAQGANEPCPLAVDSTNLIHALYTGWNASNMMEVFYTNGSADDFGGQLTSISITYPSEGEQLEAGLTYTVRWTLSGEGDIDVSNILLGYSTDGGSTYTTLYSSVYKESYDWQIPLVEGELRLKVSATLGEGVVIEDSVNIFIVPASTPGIQVTSPNGGESFIAGTTQEITWTSDGTGSVAIEYSTNSGATWTFIEPSTDNDGSYSWAVPDTPSENCLVRISMSGPDGGPSDVSDAVFSIASPLPAAIRITSPNSGERLSVGSAFEITWASNGPIGDVRIEYSIDNGTFWIIIVPSTDNDGSYNWTVPDTPSDSCLVRISESDKDIGTSDISDGGFSIVPAPFITITSPNGGEIWEVGSTHEITWNSSATIGNVKIEYSTTNGASWTTIAAATDNTGNFNWIVSDSPSENCLIRISESDGALSDSSNAVFSIVAPSSITLMTPNGGEGWEAGSTQSITWTSTGTIRDIKIEYSPDNGSTWKMITLSPDNNESYNWIIPDDPSDNCLVRISEVDVDNGPSDVSNAVFSIIPAPVISVTSPNGGERLESGSTYDITWTSKGTVNDVKIEYSTGNGSNWAAIITATANDGSHSWPIPDNPSKNCLIRISETDGTPADISDAVFSIVSPSSATITVTSPNGGESLTIGSTHEITWTSTGMNDNDNIIIQYSNDNEVSWIDIEPSTPNTGNYTWSLPDNPSIISENCLVRISGSDSDEGPSDISDAVFSIISPSSPTITVISPNGGESLTVGSTHEITWTITGMEDVENIIIEYSTDNGVSWTIIVMTTSDTGSYNWPVPDHPSDNCLIRIRLGDSDEGPSDMSDSVFSIVSAASVKVISPNGGEQWETGSAYNITWSSTGISGNIVIDLYIGDSFDFNIGTEPVDSGKFAWQIPENFTTGEDYKIFLHKDSIEDYSDSVFSITDQDPNHPDFNNDGKVDILWRNYASGMNEVWYMNGAARTGTGNLPAMADLNWRIVGTGDFNRDGKVDILWRHYTTGQNLVWYMDGMTLTGNANLPIQPDVNWQIVGTGDFNGDGKVDILWRNALEGRNQVWFMDGVTVEKYQGLQSLEGQAWRVVGSGDFNSDGKVDILWRNYSTGSNEVWYMDGGNRIGTGVLLEMSDMSWQVVGIGDFNLDREVDILWRNYSDGKNMIWYMDGITRIGYEYIETRSDLNWWIVGNGDYKN